MSEIDVLFCRLQKCGEQIIRKIYGLTILDVFIDSKNISISRGRQYTFKNAVEK